MKNRYSFTKLDNSVLDDKDLSRTARAVFTVLARHSRTIREVRMCRLHISTIAEEARYAARTVRYALKELAASGIVCRKYQFTQDGHNRASMFILTAGAEDAGGTDTSTPVSKTSYPAENAPRPADSAAYNKTIVNNIDSLKSVHTSSDSGSSSNVTEESLMPETQDNSEYPAVIRGSESGRSLHAPAEKKAAPKHKKLTEEERLNILKEKYCRNIESVPAAWQPAAEFLLVRTGRAPAALSDDELSAIRTLNARHTPARVLTEITKVCERFERNSRDTAGITFCYIEAALRNQKPTIRRKAEGDKPAARRPRENSYDVPMQYTLQDSMTVRRMFDEQLDFVLKGWKKRYVNPDSLVQECIAWPQSEAEFMLQDNRPQTQSRKELFKEI